MARKLTGTPTDLRSKIKSARQAAPGTVIPQSTPEPGFTHPIVRDPIGLGDVKPTPKPSKTLDTKTQLHGPPVHDKYTAKGYRFRKKVKPKKSKLGAQKGAWRKVDNGWKRRRFTIQERREFRSKDDTFGGPKDGRPNPKKPVKKPANY